MRILTCFKVLPDPDRVLQPDWEQFAPNMDLSYAGMDFSCFDGPTLELGLKLKKIFAEQGTEVSCSALTLGKALPESFAQRLYSVGYDRVVRIPAENGEFSPEVTAVHLAEACGNADIILTGREAGMGETGMVPYLLAELLHRPLYGDVENLSFSHGQLCLSCRKPEGLYERKPQVPFVMTVGNCPEVLRMATLRQQMKCRGRKPEEFPMEPREISTEIPCFALPDTGRSCQMLDPEEAETFPKILSILRSASREKNAPEEKVIPQMFHRAVEEKKLYLFPNTEGGRILAVRCSREKKIPCFFGGEITALTGNFLEIQKGAYGSNLIWKKKIPLPAVLTGPYEGPEEEKQEILLEKAGGEALEKAPLVVICGNGMGSRETCGKARLLADKLGAGFGLTRPGAMNAWGSLEEIVGQSGKILSPGVCLTLGAAGAGAFLAGIRKSQIIVAVNKDPNALIFKNADYGILMDAETFVERLAREVKAHGN